MKIERVHVVEAVYVGPNELHQMFPPSDALAADDGGARVREWSFEEVGGGDVVITHTNPRAGQVYKSRVGSGNLRCVQYEPAAIDAKVKK